MHTTKRIAIAALVTALAVAAACSSSSTGVGEPPAVSEVVGPAGGTVTSSDGVRVVIPPGALSTEVTITIARDEQAALPSDAQSVAPTHVFGPEGQQFLQPVRVIYPFDPSTLPRGASPQQLVMYTAPRGSSAFAPMPTSLADASHVVGETSHFSIIVPVVRFLSLDGGPTDGPSDGPTDAPPSPFGPCSADGWCSSGAGHASRGMWGSGSNDVWAVGRAGSILHFNGATWSSSASGTIADLEGVWASSSTDVWAVGLAGTVRHWNGSSWSDSTAPAVNGAAPDLRGVWGSGANDVWAVGRVGTASGVVLHGDGSTWTVSQVSDAGTFVPSLFGVWGSGSKDVWAVGSGGAIVHWDGSAWSRVIGVNAPDLRAIWGSASNDVWAVGGTTSGAVLHWNGSAWTSMQVSAPGPLNGVGGTGPNDAWAVGDDGATMHWNGSGWSSVASPFTLPPDASTGSGIAVGEPGSNELYAVWGSGQADVWATGEGGAILHFDGSAWSEVRSGVSIPNLGAVWANGSSDAWAVGQGIVHWNGSAWSVSVSGGSWLSGIWSSALNDAWAIGAEDVLHWDGISWSPMATQDGGPPMSGGSAVWGSGPSDVWLFGNGAAHWNGAAWSESLPATTIQFFGGWGSGASDVWAAGVNQASEGGITGALMHWDGSAWSIAWSGAGARLSSVWGSGASDVWASCTATNEMLHWNGSAWSPVPTPSCPRSLWGSGPNDAWGVCARGAIVHWNGSAWAASSSGTTVSLTGAGGSGSGDVWAVGVGDRAEGVILHH